MPDEIAISFAGPFSWFGASDASAVYAAEEVQRCGIYLWTVPLAEGHLIYYVGETGSSFNARSELSIGKDNQHEDMSIPLQSRCPYTLKPLSEISRITDEHIFPAAIGGPSSYCVKADENLNPTLGSTTDARFVNSKLVEMRRAVFGVQGRLSREPRSELKGEVLGSDRSVKVKIREDAPIVEYDPLVKIDVLMVVMR
jgi:hypothetical protein